MARTRKLPKVLTTDERQALLAHCNTRYATPHRNLCMLRVLGHADLSTTMIYTHIVDEELESALKGFRRSPKQS